MSAAVDAAPAERTSARVHVQKFGTFLSNMIMPNIGAIIAWGFITALFIPVGPFGAEGVIGKNNESIAKFASFVSTMVDPGIFFLLPLLIAYAGGKIVHDVRGGVVGAFATLGVIMPTSGTVASSALAENGKSIFANNFDWAQGSAPMFLGAMIMGPLTAWLMKKWDDSVHHRIRPGFEMLVNNFSAGILAMIMAIVGMFTVAPVVLWIVKMLGKAVKALVDNSLLPLTSLFIEPAKIFFLNNAINHGVLTPLGINEVKESGKSVLFLLEANPGPGLGILLAYMIFGRGVAKASAPGAAIVHFLGGIHEIYFPYVLAKPKLLLAAIAGGMTGVALNVMLGTGLVAPAAPGSIFAIWAQAQGDFLKVTLAVLGATVVSFLVAAFLLRTDKSDDDGDLSAATAEMEARKGKKSAAAGMLAGGAAGAGAVSAEGHSGPIKNIVFACDAGMGSSAMGASVLRKKVQAAGFDDVSVVNKAIANLTDTFDLVVSHQDLTPRARQRTGSAVHVSVDNFMGSPRYDEIVELLERTNRGGGDAVPAGATTGGAAASGAAVGAGAGAAAAPAMTKHDATPAPAAATAASSSSVLSDNAIVVNGSARDKAGAITEAGELLVQSGAVDSRYVDAMHERETSVSTYMGNLLAIPHGTNEAKELISRSAISFVKYPNGIDWNGKEVKFVIGIAGQGNDHMALLGKIAEVFLDKDQVARLEAANSPAEISQILGNVN